MTPNASDICVIGGGPSGLMAAITAAGQGAQTSILERMDRVGKKLLATGNGRCNFTHVNMSPLHFHGQHPDFAKPVLKQFGLNETLTFFESLGMVWKSDEAGRVFPVTDQASTVLDLLRYEAGRLHIKEYCGTEVIRIHPSNNRFVIQSKNSRTFSCKKVILAAGGKAAPNLGSAGSGYALAQQLGHGMVEPFPAIVQAKLQAPFWKRFRGIKAFAGVSLKDNNGSLAAEQGEILFTDYGLSGLPVLQLSRRIHELIRKGQKPYLKVDLFPNQSDEALSKQIVERFRRLAYKKAGDACVGLLNKRLASVLLSLAGIEENAPAEKIKPVDLQRFARLLKNWNIEAVGTQSWSEAQVTAGGVRTDDIAPQTLESKIVPGLFFAGEILDIDGDCGGYNLQWAWSSGRVSGMHASSGYHSIP